MAPVFNMGTNKMFTKLSYEPLEPVPEILNCHQKYLKIPNKDSSKNKLCYTEITAADWFTMAWILNINSRYPNFGEYLIVLGNDSICLYFCINNFVKFGKQLNTIRRCPSWILPIIIVIHLLY